MADRNTRLERRIARLEKAVFGHNSNTRRTIKAQQSASGPAGGVRMLIDTGFFKGKRNLGDVRTQLEKHEYYYSTQVIDTALRRLAKKNGPLVIVKQNGNNLYVKRK
jgi:hypothetical protein